MLGAVAFQQLAEGLGAGFVGGAGRYLVGLEGEQVAPAGYLRIADRIAARPGRDEAPGEAGEQRLQFAGVGELAVQFAGAQQLLAQARIGHLGDLATVAQVALQRAVGTTFPQRPEIGGEQFVGVETERAVVGLAELLHDGAQAQLRRGGDTEGVQPQRHRRAGQSVQVVVEHAEERREILAHRCLAPAQVVVHVRRPHRRADLLGAAFAHRALVQLLVFVDQLVQVAQFVVQPGRGERRRLVADGDRAPAPARLDRLANVVLDVRVEHRQVAERPQRVVAHRQPAVLAG